MKRHCFFIGTSLGDNPVPHHFVALAKELARRGHQAVLIAPHRRIDLADPDANPAIHTWPSERPTGMRDALFLLRLIRDFQPSSMIANFGAVNLMTVIGLFARVPNRVVWYHTISGQLTRDNGSPQWKSRLLNFRKRMVYRAATHFVANSNASAADLQAVYAVPAEKCRVFFNSLADPYIGGLSPAQVQERKLICVGRFFPSKGQDVLIRAAAQLIRKFADLRVEFVGEGPAMESCKSLARVLGVSERCIFSGQVPHRKVLKKMSTATATVVPSRSEAFGLVNIESMAVRTPVIASAVGGIKEIIRDGIDGFLVPPDDPEALAAALKKVLSSPALRNEMSAQARQRFLTNFEQSRLVREQADWQEALVSGTVQPLTTGAIHGAPI